MDSPAKALLDRARAARESEGLPAFALVLQRGDDVLLDVVEGADADTRFVTFSASKGVVSAVVAGLLDDGVLELGRRVVEVLPWFTGDGKEAITVEHLLLHTAGLATAPMRPDQAVDPDRRRERMASWRTAHEPGARFRYHATSAHWVLAEVVEELSGSPLHRLVEQRVAAALGLRSLALEGGVDFAPVELVGTTTPPEVLEHLAAAGFDVADAVGEAAADNLLVFNRPEAMACRMPAAMVASTARDLADLYLALARCDERLASPATVRDVTRNVRNNLPDPLFGGTAGRSLGFIVAGDDGDALRRGLPQGLAPTTFGQPGTAGQIAWADPERELVFTFLTNGVQRDPLVWFQRMAELNALAAACA